MTTDLPRTDVPDPRSWSALHDGAVVVDLPSVGGLRLTGPDRVAFLHGQLAQDLRSLPVGGSARSLYLDVRGHALSEMRVQRRDDDLHIAVEDDAADEVIARLQAHRVFDDVEIADLRAQLACLTVQGPRAAEIVERAVGAAVPGDGGTFAQTAWNEADLLIVRHRRTVPGGFDVHCLVRDATGVRSALIEAGAAGGDRETLEASRIEAMLPRAGADAGSGVLPQEAGLDDAISTTKGCYLGQETMARIEARARLRRTLVRLRLERAPGDDTARPDVTLDGRAVGKLGTRVHHPRLGPIALAVLRNDLDQDAPLEVDGVPAAILRP